jgi:hypothetical protein
MHGFDLDEAHDEYESILTLARGEASDRKETVDITSIVSKTNYKTECEQNKVYCNPCEYQEYVGDLGG